MSLRSARAKSLCGNWLEEAASSYLPSHNQLAVEEKKRHAQPHALSPGSRLSSASHVWHPASGETRDTGPASYEYEYGPLRPLESAEPRRASVGSKTGLLCYRGAKAGAGFERSQQMSVQRSRPMVHGRRSPSTPEITTTGPRAVLCIGPGSCRHCLASYLCPSMFPAAPSATLSRSTADLPWPAPR